MKVIRFVSLFATFFATLLIVLISAQTNYVLANQGGAFPDTHVPHAEQSKTHDVDAAPNTPPPPFIFLPDVEYNSNGTNAHSVAVGDLNGDGKLDIAVANICASITSCPNGGAPGGVSILLGNGDGTFQPAVSYSSGGLLALSIAIGDVNGDGKPDLVVANGCASGSSCAANQNAGSVSVLLGNGDGTFQAPISYSSGGDEADSVAIGDLNGDGKLDIAVANECANGTTCNTAGSVSVLLGNGDGTFQAPVSYGSAGAAAVSVVIGDLNGDGKPDLVVANIIQSEQGTIHGEVGVLLGNGDGTFKAPIGYNTVSYDSESVAIGDVNGDGKPDLVVAGLCQNNPCNQGVSVLLGKGDGTFKTAVTYSSGAMASYSVVIEDLNGDGIPDLALANWAPPSVGVMLGNGNGTFQSPEIYNASGGYCCFGTNSVAVGDVNGDGKPDLIVANTCGDPGCMAGAVDVLLNNSGAPSSTTSLVSSVNPVNNSQSVTYTAAVAIQSGGALRGTVVFQDSGTTVATVPLANNQAKFTTTYKNYQAGTHTITAIYPGSLHVASSSEASLTEVVRSDSTQTALVTSGSPSVLGQPVTFTATVTSHYGAIPDGELVTFYTASKPLASVPLAGGKAAYTTSALSVGKHSIKAGYVGDNKFKPSAGYVTQIVNP